MRVNINLILTFASLFSFLTAFISSLLSFNQGDQIGQIFADLVDCFHCAFFVITNVAEIVTLQKVVY
jgi:hypothetical protein